MAHWVGSYGGGCGWAESDIADGADSSMEKERGIGRGIVIVVLLLILVGPATAALPGDISNLAPTVASFSVYADTGLVLDVIGRDSNEGADIDHIRIDVHETDSLGSPVVCWFETPTNLTKTLGGPNGEYALVFKRLTPEEANPILTGKHIYEANVTDDDGSYGTGTAVHDFNGAPTFVNQAASGSYIHRSDNNPTPDQVVEFTVYVRDFNTPPAGLTVQYHYSRDGRVTWDTRIMVYDAILENWVTSLGPFPGRTEVWYYVTADDGDVETRTPSTYEFIVWDPAGISLPIVTELREMVTLYKGWNLVSVGLVTTLRASTFTALDPYIESVVSRDPEGRFLTYARNMGASEDFDMEYEHGYYIYVSQVTVVEIVGVSGVLESLWLSDGWNLYGVSEDRSSLELFDETSINTVVGRNYRGKYWTCGEGLPLSDKLLKDDEGLFLYPTESERWYP